MRKRIPGLTADNVDQQTTHAGDGIQRLNINLINAQSNGLFSAMYVFDPETFYSLIALAVVVVVVSLTIYATVKASETEKSTETIANQ